MSALSNSLSMPSNWSTQTNEVEEIELSASSFEYQDIESILKGKSRYKLEKITRVQNPYLYNRYNLRKLEYKFLGCRITERKLFHATAASKIPSIIQDNLDWRRFARAKFGKGVSFSTSSNYANKYCSIANGDERAMIIANVLVGRKCQGRSTMNITPKGFNTAIGSSGKVHVKFYDDEFYPTYVAYYKNNRVIHTSRRVVGFASNIDRVGYRYYCYRNRYFKKYIDYSDFDDISEYSNDSAMYMYDDMPYDFYNYIDFEDMAEYYSKDNYSDIMFDMYDKNMPSYDDFVYNFD